MSLNSFLGFDLWNTNDLCTIFKSDLTEKLWKRNSILWNNVRLLWLINYIISMVQWYSQTKYQFRQVWWILFKHFRLKMTCDVNQINIVKIPIFIIPLENFKRFVFYDSAPTFQDTRWTFKFENSWWSWAWIFPLFWAHPRRWNHLWVRK